ncbi:MAG: hypothetical protein AABW86_03700 [Candidatus Micrarchaeota archaeon]
MSGCANVTLDAMYNEILTIKKELLKLETVLIPEVTLTVNEMKELRKLKEEAKRELKEGKLISIEAL